MNRSKKRLLLCASSMDGGGSEKQLLYLLKHLDREQFEIFLYLLYPTGSLLPEVPSDVRILSYWSQRRAPRFNWPGRIHRAQVRHLHKTILDHQIDCVYDRLYHMALIAGPAVRETSAIRLATIVSPPSKDLVRNEKRWLQQKKNRLRKSYLEANQLYAVDSSTAQDASLFYEIPRESIKVLPSPLDTKRIDELKESVWEGKPLNPEATNIISIGRLSEEKGHSYLLRALHKYQIAKGGTKLPDITLHLVGDGVLRKELESLAASLGVTAQVTFHGHVANPFPLLKNCSLFVLPSLYEGLPNAVLEAMYMQVPVLATATSGGVGDMLQTKNLGAIVPSANADALFEAILHRFEEPSVWESRLVPARDHICSHHSLDQWLGTLSTALNSSEKQPSY